MKQPKSPAGQRHVWSPADVQLLRLHYADTSTQDLATALGLTPDQVRRKAMDMGLKKTHEYKSAVSRAAVTTAGHGSIKHQFKPGQTPANKGMKMPKGWAPGRMADSQFRPGHRPYTWVPVGSFRICDGVLQQKYSDEPGSPTRRWKAYARVVWEQAHGEVPAGHRVAFRPGCATTDPAKVTLDTVELVTMQELMRRNSIHQMPPELYEISRIRARLTRAINQREEA